jgi:spore maturation protein CgeB
LKILLGHTFPVRSAFGAPWIESWLRRLRSAGIDVHPFSLVINPNRPIIYFQELDVLWRYRDRRLLTMYDRLGTELTKYDAFVCYTGGNVHPEFARQLSCTTVYGCFDDPESSEKLSKPVAAAFDIAMVGNIAEVEAYKSWGAKNVRWWPLGFREDDYDPGLREEDILFREREVDVTMLCERVTRYRRKRVDAFVTAYPGGAYYGRGWPSGFLPESKRVPLLQRTRVGINIHNSTGPINFRTFYLPANGVMQICDNKAHLGKIFSLGAEVIGYDSMEEAIELTRFYLEREDERRRIAAAGWKRTLKDYNEVACFQLVLDAISEETAKNPKVKNADYRSLFVETEGSFSIWKRAVIRFILRAKVLLTSKLRGLARVLIG